jgi:hypothetical protein
MAAVAICKATVLKSNKKCTHKAKNGTEYCGYHKKFVVSQNATVATSSTSRVQVVPPPPPPPPAPAPAPTPTENKECVICLTNMTTDSMQRTVCNHTFHSKCLKEWTKRKNTCPCCRTTLPINNRTDGRRSRQEYENMVENVVLRARSSALINGIENHLISWAMTFSLNELNRMRDLYPNDSSEYRRYTEVIAIRNHEDAMNAVY